MARIFVTCFLICLYCLGIMLFYAVISFTFSYADFISRILQLFAIGQHKNLHAFVLFTLAVVNASDMVVGETGDK